MTPMAFLHRATHSPVRLTVVAAAASAPGAPPMPARALTFALGASIAFHLVLVAGLRWGVDGRPSGDPGTQPPDAEPVPLVVELSSAGGDGVAFRVRAAGTSYGVTAAPVPDASAGIGRRPAMSAPPPDLRGVVTVSQSDDIGLVDSALAPHLAAEFRKPAAEPPRLESELGVVYPRIALPARRQMQVGVLVVVGENGEIESTKKSFDDTLFAPLIDAALANARFVPAMRDGRPVRSWTVLAFHFEVEGSPKFP